KILVLSGTLLKGMDQDFYYRIILKMRESHVRVILDSDGEEFRRGLEARPYLIKPNSFELARLVGRQIHTDTEVAAAAHEVLERRVEVVLVSRGGRGAVLITKDLQLIAYPPKVKVDSAVGAGDSMLAGVAIKLTEGASLDEALRFGVACGTATVITPGTELCFPRDVLKFLPQVQVEEFRPA
ncbi:MAG: bifunctional hydroxymethylpyrimidine kinase/phosphomethylpyrimidine kinase, partial [Deinococcus sp.]|nr:bifunctional hydroxymethylpyrimidine kinase/phosphomethylpyrimidine kinase [Deinococcus sp.]